MSTPSTGVREKKADKESDTRSAMDHATSAHELTCKGRRGTRFVSPEGSLQPLHFVSRLRATSRCVHPVDFVLISFLHRFPFQLERRCH